ncbi:Ubiquinol oxidase 4, chloroplastic/chromoplastic [Apostasia shenzhenica]|uniref:Ubiquinol oxidase 4, chloroplastic/chromoplastic n=1 Tax=Apostasia shenzhenica TaxID=1088818 RepID=A0A2I0B709_9ASPA|nr:Ubiquinol oxidase 4, chloroplastic/chromoplastic [Apostasia shenzhenica]
MELILTWAEKATLDFIATYIDALLIENIQSRLEIHVRIIPDPLTHYAALMGSSDVTANSPRVVQVERLAIRDKATALLLLLLLRQLSGGDGGRSLSFALGLSALQFDENTALILLRFGSSHDDTSAKAPGALEKWVIKFEQSLNIFLTELGGNAFWFDRFLAQHVAVVYYFMTVFMYALSPRMACEYCYIWVKSRPNMNINVTFYQITGLTLYTSKMHENYDFKELKKLPAPQAAIDYYMNEDLYLFGRPYKSVLIH